MKVGLSCIITPQQWGFQETLTNAKEAGYEALELVIREDGPITLQTPEAELARMARQAADQGFEVASLCPMLRSTPKDVMTNDAAIREASMETIKRCIGATKAMGVDTMLLTLGALTPQLYYNEAYANALQSLQKIAPVAEDAGVNIAIEYVWNKFLLSPMEFARFCDEVASPRVGFFFDTGNMTIFGFAEQWVRICGKHLMMVHFKDFKRAGYQWTPLLQGDVDFPAVMTELRKIGYNRPLLSEVDPGTAPLADTAEAIRKIKQM